MLRERDGSANLAVRVQTRSSRNEIVGERNSRLLVRVNAPPVEGKANKALCKLLAKHVGIPRGRVSVVRGERSRDKVVRLDGVSAAEAASFFAKS